MWREDGSTPLVLGSSSLNPNSPPASTANWEESTLRFMLMRKADAETEAGLLPSAELLAVMQRYNEELADAGVLLQDEGLQASANGARVTFTDGAPTVTDGPFAETKELIAGFTMIEVVSKDEVIEWVKRWPRIDGHGNVEIEILPLYEPEDFSSGATESS